MNYRTTIYEQVDAPLAGERPARCWIVGRLYFDTPAGHRRITGKEMQAMGWRINMRRDSCLDVCYVTDDPAAVVKLMAAAPWLSLPVANGTQDRHGMPMFDFGSFSSTEEPA